MALTYSEATLFARAGDDMRRAAWPQGHFVRLVEQGRPAPAGWVGHPYVATQADIKATDWRRA